jgi:hypothetical protein
MRQLPTKHIFQFLLAGTAFLLQMPPAAADDTVTVNSSDDGHGLYSYTFSSDSTNEYFTLGAVIIQSHGILGTTQPPGWTVSIDTNDYIQWDYTDGYLPLTNAVTFSVQSGYPVPRVYNDVDYPSELAGGISLIIVYADPAFQLELGGGYQRFSYFGPSTNGAPTVYLQTVDTNIVVGWHAAAVGHMLETSTNLAQTNGWTLLTNSILIGHSNFVTVPALAWPQFFRTLDTNAP